MNPIVQKIQSHQRHKKATSTFHHINHHYHQDHEKERQKSKEERLSSNAHKRAKSFSRESFKPNLNHEHYVERINGKLSDQNRSQLLKPYKKAKNQKSFKEKKEDFVREYIKSVSESRRTKKKQKPKLQLRPAKLSPETKSLSKSAKKFKVTKQPKNIKLKIQSQERKNHSKQISREKTSKDSKASKNRKSEHSNNAKKTQKKIQIENKLGSERKGLSINFKNITTKDRQLQQPYPMTPDQVTERFSGYFNETEINQMKEYKLIYFLGKEFHQKQKKMIHSERESKRRIVQNEDSYPNQKNHQYFQTENVPIQKRPLYEQEDVSQFYKYTVGQHIAYRYEIISSINRGSFGEVLKVFDHKKKQCMAIKVVKKSKQLVQQTFVEISILTHLKQNDKANTSGIVRIKDFLLFRNHICIVFQLLDGNLYELLTANSFKGFNEEVIRLFAIQILNSLNFLKKQKIIHCDLKPQNLVMKQWGKSGIKLIDFGTSCFSGKQMYTYLQSRYYRAPEVFMQMPYSYPIDMWSFGCMMAQFKTGEPLFSGRSTIQQLTYICSCIGVPNKNDGLFSLAFLQNQKMKQVLENNYFLCDRQNGLNLGQDVFFDKYQERLKKDCMINLEKRLSKKGNLNPHFLDFIQKILVWEPQKRLTPQQALRHTWITKGLSSEIYSLYSSFNTSQSCSRSKKRSKDSKTSNQSKSKTKVKNTRKTKKNQIILANLNEEDKKNEENKIIFSHKNKKTSQDECFFLQSRRQSLEIANQGNGKLDSLTYKKELQNLHRTK